MTELRKWELEKITYWNKKIYDKIDFNYDSIILLQYNNVEAFYLIDTTTYKLTNKKFTIVCEH